MFVAMDPSATEPNTVEEVSDRWDDLESMECEDLVLVVSWESSDMFWSRSGERSNSILDSCSLLESVLPLPVMERGSSSSPVCMWRMESCRLLARLFIVV